MRPPISTTPWLAVAAASALVSCASSYHEAPERLPDGGYVALQHHGTNPVIDTEERSAVRLGIATDRAAWALVHHYLERGALPPPEAVRVEDCVTAMAPAPRRTTKAMALSATLAVSPFRAGWHTLVISVAAGRGAGSEASLAVVSATPDGALERALAAAGASVTEGGADALSVALETSKRVVFVGDAAGLGGPAAQAPLLARASASRAQGGVLSVVGRLGPGMDDALLDRLAYTGGGTYDIIAPGEERALARALLKDHALTATMAEVRFDPAVVTRWRLVGHESRVARPPLVPIGGLVRSGDGAHLVFELKLARSVGVAVPLGVARVSAREAEREIAIGWSEADATHRAVIAVATFAEKLRGSYWGKDVGWPALADEITRLPSPALRDELGALVERARALEAAELGIESAIDRRRALP